MVNRTKKVYTGRRPYWSHSLAQLLPHGFRFRLPLNPGVLLRGSVVTALLQTSYFLRHSNIRPFGLAVRLPPLPFDSGDGSFRSYYGFG